MNKEVQVILNILKSYDNVIPDELISKIFENLKFVYRTPSYTGFVCYRNIHITNFRRIYEINNEFYEFSFTFEMPTNKTTTIKFYGAYTYPDNSVGIISCLHFETEEIRDEIFNYICSNIEFNFRSTFIEIKNEQ